MQDYRKGGFASQAEASCYVQEIENLRSLADSLIATSELFEEAFGELAQGGDTSGWKLAIDKCVQDVDCLIAGYDARRML